MREVRLGSKQYKLAPGSDIIKRTVSPWIAKISAGSLEYSDFGSANIEEYHDLRNGIGLQSALPDESSRLWWTEGIDFSTARSAVLGPLVTTAGAFGVAPVKIIDFENATYAIGDGKIAKWNTDTSAWDLKGLLIEDCEDSWTSDAGSGGASTSKVKVGTYSINAVIGQNVTGLITHEVISSIDLSTYTKINFWFYSVGRNLAEGDVQLLLDDTAACTSPIATMDLPAITSNTWTACSLTLPNPALYTAIISVGLKQIATPTETYCYHIDQIVADGYVASPIDAIVATDTTDSYLVVSSAETAMCFDGTSWKYLGGQGCLAFYDTKLRSISTDGKTLYSSAANDIDGTWTNITLSGNFGTVYSLFEGKLLEDGSPTLYFCGTEGLFTIDTPYEKAYKQEVEYSPLTYAGHKGLYWNANVWVATGYGILKLSPSMATFVGPDLDDGLPATYQGSIYDMVTVNNWLVYCVNKATSSDKSSILKRNSSYGGNLQVYTSAADTAITCLCHSPSSLYTNGRLWFGEGTNVKYMMFPDITSNVKQISSYEYVDDSGYGQFPIFRKLAAITKVALGVSAITKSCDDNEYINVYYGLNGAAPTTAVGTGSFKTSPKPTALTFGSGLGIEFYTIQFAIKLIRGTTDENSPELESLIFYWYGTPSRVSAWTFNILATGDEGNTIFTEFETIFDTNTLVAFYPSGDSSKTSYNVKLTQMPSREWWENRGQKEGVFQATCQEIFNG